MGSGPCSTHPTLADYLRLTEEWAWLLAREFRRLLAGNVSQEGLCARIILTYSTLEGEKAEESGTQPPPVTSEAPVADRAWKQEERHAARLLGGQRYPANAGGLVDCEGPWAVAQCKHVCRRLSLAELERLAIEAEREGAARGKAGLVVVTAPRGGRSVTNARLFIMTAGTWISVIGTGGINRNQTIKGGRLDGAATERQGSGGNAGVLRGGHPQVAIPAPASGVKVGRLTRLRVTDLEAFIQRTADTGAPRLAATSP